MKIPTETTEALHKSTISEGYQLSDSYHISIICLISNIIKLSIILKQYQIFFNQCYQIMMSNSLYENALALFNDTLYLTIIPRARVGYEIVNSQRGA